MSELPWVECGEVFYGWSEPDALTLDFSVSRACNLPKDHRGICDMARVYPAGHFPRPETRYERGKRLRDEARRRATTGPDVEWKVS